MSTTIDDTTQKKDQFSLFDKKIRFDCLFGELNGTRYRYRGFVTHLDFVRIPVGLKTNSGDN